MRHLLPSRQVFGMPFFVLGQLHCPKGLAKFEECEKFCDFQKLRILQSLVVWRVSGVCSETPQKYKKKMETPKILKLLKFSMSKIQNS